MADNLDFSVATFATTSMMPVGDEEVNAVWARQAMWNVAMAIGPWSTTVLGTGGVGAGSQFGATQITFPGNFKHIPSIDIFQLRGGTNVTEVPFVSPSAHSPSRPCGLYLTWSGGPPITVLTVWYYPDHRDLNSVRDFTGSIAQFGTFIYRFRGW